MHRLLLLLAVVQMCLLMAQAEDDPFCSGKLDGTVLPHPENSASFIVCVNEVHSTEICPESQVFAEDIKACVPETISSSDPPTTTDDSDELHPTVSTTESITTPTITPSALPTPAVTHSSATPMRPTDGPSADLLAEPLVCPCRDTELPTYYANQRYCDKYFLCYRSRPLEMTCCLGHHWDARRHMCIPASQSRCGQVQPVPASHVPDCPAQGCTFYPHPSVCAYFYYCENGVRSIQQCDAFYEWDFYSQRCLVKSQARCITSIPEHLRRQYYV